jgi:hypothetical protein
MLKLSDVEMTAILDAAAPLPVERRDGFLQAVAASLQSYGEIGPGAIHRVCAEAQRAFFDPPDLSRSRFSVDAGGLGAASSLAAALLKNSATIWRARCGLCPATASVRSASSAGVSRSAPAQRSPHAPR